MSKASFSGNTKFRGASRLRLKRIILRKPRVGSATGPGLGCQREVHGGTATCITSPGPLPSGTVTWTVRNGNGQLRTEPGEAPGGMVTDMICCCGTTVAGATFWWSPAIPQSLSVLSPDPETTRRPSGDTATPLTYNEDPVHKSSTQSGRRAPHVTRVPFQRRHAFARRHVPHLERVVPRPRHDAPPVRKHRNAADLRRNDAPPVRKHRNASDLQR